MTARHIIAISAAAIVAAHPTAFAESEAGAYLAARHAQAVGDFASASRLYGIAVDGELATEASLRAGAASSILIGDFAAAAEIARKADARGLTVNYGNIALIVEAVLDDDYDAVTARIDAGKGLGPVADGLIAAWAQVGKGDMSGGMDMFDGIAESIEDLGETERETLGRYADFSKSLAMAMAGDFEGAERLLAVNGGPGGRRTERNVIAWVEVLALLDRHDEAVSLLDVAFGSDPQPAVLALRARLVAREPVPFSLARSARDGIAELLFSLAHELGSASEMAAVYAQASVRLNPEPGDSILLLARQFMALESYNLAADAFARVADDAPEHALAELGRVEALRGAGRTQEAIAALDALARQRPELAEAHHQLGDLLRADGRYDEAIDAYGQAIAAFGDSDARWAAYYGRGISFERLDRWDEADADFRQALRANPEEASLLNYFGYSMLQRGFDTDSDAKLKQAKSLIRRAAELDRNSGYIADSLGWSLHLLGEHDKALTELERAVTLAVAEPVINDHLGDVLWTVGRRREAVFQWKRAIDFSTRVETSDPVNVELITLKIEKGLEDALAQWGARAENES